MKKIRFNCAFLVFILILSGCSSSEFEPELDLKVMDFEYTNQRNEVISLEKLKGTPWLAMFIYTRCNTVCPPMTSNMADVHAAIEKEGIENYKIVGFSVDPAYDSPEILSNYLSYYPIENVSKWELLTGYEQAEITQFALQSFNTVAKKLTGSDDVIHDIKYFLVDQNGIVVKSYDGYTDVPIEEIVTDLKSVQR
ncbi:SCO family protein [Lysinibacillus sp. SGAir0095]|uniref:SCO family protein n=1 Tax=Lysinibacillus sp. SGAir0095 TaxID=2070463 RepID=UPI0010CD1DDD|nr:SCO family protein [Lysinibacillus sp. SGAir0095]QCR33666.1 cytochrome c oxidase assembly protein [Lysinibacillus sp. SGAir0095]